MTDTLRSLIGAEWASSSQTFDDVNPARPDEMVAVVEAADATHVEAAAKAARSAFAAWRRTPAPQRADRLLAVAELLLERSADIGRDMAREEGKTFPEAVAEVRGSAAQFRYAAARALEPDGSTVSPRDPQTAMLWSRREPVGVIACITPWNFPSSIPAWKLAHAVAAGNTVVWKPAEITPLTSVGIMRCIVDAGVSPGVVNMLLGEGPVIGQALVTTPGVDAVSFTGSTAVGTQIARQVDQPRVRLQLEMGGSNPAIVLDDADLELAAREIGTGAFSSSGQKCTATARVIAMDAVYDELVDRLVHEAGTWTVGDPLAATTRLGPVASAGQFRHVAGHLAAAPRAKLVAGAAEGPGDGRDGFFIQPTVFAGVAVDEPIVVEEVFGPVTSVLRAASVDEAIAMANATRYGLSSSVFTRDIGRALQFADAAEAGVVKVNKATTGNEIHVPFGGRKDSGAGAPEMGWATWEFYTQWKTVYIAAAPERAG